jgi:cell division septum initiation protein DivIVA
MRNIKNSGTIVGGSVAKGAAVAGGEGARAEVNTLLRELTRAIDDHLDDHGRVQRGAETVEEEIDRGAPSRRTVRSLLAEIAAAAGSAERVAAAAAALRSAIS